MKSNNFRNKLLIALAFFLIVLGLIFFGFTLIVKYSSRTFVLNKLIQNINLENENSLKTKILLIDNIKNYELLKLYTIDKEDEVPVVISEIEYYADSLKIPIKITAINVIDQTQNNSNDSEESLEASLHGKKLNVEIQSNADFNNLIKLLKMLENSRYIISIDKYHLRQVVISGSIGSSGDLVFTEIHHNTQMQLGQTKTWLLSASLSIATDIK